MSQFEDRIKTALRDKGYEVYDRGWPDCLVTDRFGFRGFGLELKYPGNLITPRARERLSKDQERMHEALTKLGLSVHVSYGDLERLLHLCDQKLQLPVRSTGERILARAIRMRRLANYYRRSAATAEKHWRKWAAANPDRAKLVSSQSSVGAR